MELYSCYWDVLDDIDITNSKTMNELKTYRFKSITSRKKITDLNFNIIKYE